MPPVLTGMVSSRQPSAARADDVNRREGILRNAGTETHVCRPAVIAERRSRAALLNVVTFHLVPLALRVYTPARCGSSGKRPSAHRFSSTGYSRCSGVGFASATT
jgi:hypothetical protein